MSQSPFRATIPAILLCVAAPGLDGCRPSDPELPKTEGDRVASGAFDNPSAVIRSVSFEGDWCSDDDAKVSPSRDGQAVTVTFSTTLAGGPSARCSVLFDLDVPEGYQLGAPALDVRAVGRRATLTRTYGFEGGDLAPAISDELTGTGTEGLTDLHHRDSPDLWSPTCGVATTVRFAATFDATVGEDDPRALFAISSFDFGTDWRLGAAWRKGCGQSSVVVEAAPAAAGDWCAGPHERACATGLDCEYDLNGADLREGSCVDSSERLPPANLDEPCGGLRQITCADGLVCWEPSDDAIRYQWLGRCRAPAGGEGAVCQQGIPELPCRADLFCRASTHLCVAADGQLGSLCGQGLPACAAGLKCGVEQSCVPANTFWYLRSGATGLGYDEQTRFTPFTSAKVLVRTFEVTAPSWLVDGDSAVVNATNQLDGAGSGEDRFVTEEGTVMVPGSAILVPPQGGDPRKARFAIRYREMGRHRALLDLGAEPPALTVESEADVCANVSCADDRRCALDPDGQPTCGTDPPRGP